MAGSLVSLRMHPYLAPLLMFPSPLAHSEYSVLIRVAISATETVVTV